MASIKDVLKKLNKDKADADKFLPASQQPEDYFDWKFWSSGSAYLDSELGGGIPRGLVINTGFNAAGKTSLALMIAAQVTAEKKTVVYFDGEHSVKKGVGSFPAKELGVDFDYFIHSKGANLEAMLDAAEAFALSEDVGMIVMDSIKAFNPTAVEAKSAEEHSMGVQARKYGERINILLDLCERRDILVWGINQWRENIGTMSPDKRTLPGGGWQEYFACMILDLTKKTDSLLFDSDKKLIGHRMDIRVKKSKIKAELPKEVISVDFYYNVGFDNEADTYKLLVQQGVIERKGGWFYFPEEDGVDKIQGGANVLAYLKDNPEYLAELAKRLN